RELLFLVVDREQDREFAAGRRSHGASMTQPLRWLARIMIAASIMILAACATHHETRGSDASRDGTASAPQSPPTSLPQAGVTPVVVKAELEAKAFAPDKVKVAIHLPPGYDPASATTYPVLYL